MSSRNKSYRTKPPFMSFPDEDLYETDSDSSKEKPSNILITPESSEYDDYMGEKDEEKTDVTTVDENSVSDVEDNLATRGEEEEEEEEEDDITTKGPDDMQSESELSSTDDEDDEKPNSNKQEEFSDMSEADKENTTVYGAPLFTDTENDDVTSSTLLEDDNDSDEIADDDKNSDNRDDSDEMTDDDKSSDDRDDSDDYVESSSLSESDTDSEYTGNESSAETVSEEDDEDVALEYLV